MRLLALVILALSLSAYSAFAAGKWADAGRWDAAVRAPTISIAIGY